MRPKRITHPTILAAAGMAAGLAASTLMTEVQAAEVPEAGLTVEEARVEHACRELQKLKCPATDTDIDTDISAGLKTPSPLLAASQQPNPIGAATALGARLWRTSQHTKDAQIVDDRPLFWRRLQIKAAFKHQQINGDAKLLDAFERASRGFSDIQFTSDADLKIMLTGFDPFGLHNRLNQSNPSGAAVLSLDGLVIKSQGITAELQSAVFPVRFADFDAGMVESVLEPLLESESIDAIITISMGRSGFDLERFPARRRSATAPDNLMVTTSASSTNPLVPSLRGQPLNGPEFVEFSLPVKGMLSIQHPYPVTDNRKVATLARGSFKAIDLADLDNQTSVNGSGGGYLSNEISYRSILLSQTNPSKAVPTGHIHTPRIQGYDYADNLQIVRQIQTMIEAALPELSRLRLRAADR